MPAKVKPGDFVFVESYQTVLATVIEVGPETTKLSSSGFSDYIYMPTAGLRPISTLRAFWWVIFRK